MQLDLLYQRVIPMRPCPFIWVEILVVYDTVLDEDNTCNDDQIITASTLFRKAKGNAVLY